MTCLINGAAASQLDARDRGLAYGDGVFETLLARPGHLPVWPLHMRRLAAGCRRLGIAEPNAARLAAEATSLLQHHGNGVIKLLITRGSGGRGYLPPAEPQVQRIVQWSPAPTFAHAPWHGVTVRQCRLKLACQPALAGIKHLNRLEQVLARQEWRDPAIAEGLLCDQHDHLIEATSGNVLVVYADHVVIPLLDKQGVAGIMQQRLVAELQRLAIHCEQRRLSWSEALNAESMIISNAVIGCWPVTEIRLLNGSAVTLRVPEWLAGLQQLFNSQDGINRLCDS